jgi:hypothetical protein
MKESPTTFEEQARPYCMVDAVQYYTSGEHDEASHLYELAGLADEKMSAAEETKAGALISRDRNMYYDASEDARYWYDEGRDALTTLRALFNNAKARHDGHPRAAR